MSLSHNNDDDRYLFANELFWMIFAQCDISTLLLFSKTSKLMHLLIEDVFKSMVRKNLFFNLFASDQFSNAKKFVTGKPNFSPWFLEYIISENEIRMKTNYLDDRIETFQFKPSLLSTSCEEKLKYFQENIEALALILKKNINEDDLDQNQIIIVDYLTVILIQNRNTKEVILKVENILDEFLNVKKKQSVQNFLLDRVIEHKAIEHSEHSALTESICESLHQYLNDKGDKRNLNEIKSVLFCEIIKLRSAKNLAFFFADTNFIDFCIMKPDIFKKCLTVLNQYTPGLVIHLCEQAKTKYEKNVFDGFRPQFYNLLSTTNSYLTFKYLLNLFPDFINNPFSITITLLATMMITKQKNHFEYLLQFIDEQLNDSVNKKLIYDCSLSSFFYNSCFQKFELKNDYLFYIEKLITSKNAVILISEDLKNLNINKNVISKFALASASKWLRIFSGNFSIRENDIYQIRSRNLTVIINLLSELDPKDKKQFFLKLQPFLPEFFRKFNEPQCRQRLLFNLVRIITKIPLKPFSFTKEGDPIERLDEILEFYKKFSKIGMELFPFVITDYNETYKRALEALRSMFVSEIYQIYVNQPTKNLEKMNIDIDNYINQDPENRMQKLIEQLRAVPEEDNEKKMSIGMCRLV